MKIVIDTIGLGNRPMVRHCVLIEPIADSRQRRIFRVLDTVSSLAKSHLKAQRVRLGEHAVIGTLESHLIDNTREFITCKCHF